MEEKIAVKILDELREFREENNKRWEENEKRWKENDKRWEQSEKRWKENEKRWEENNKRLDKIDKHLEEHDQEILELNNAREKDRKELLEILDRMQNSITEQITNLEENMNTKLDMFGALLISNNMDQIKLKKAINKNTARLDFYNVRIEILEKWKKQMEDGQFFAV